MRHWREKYNAFREALKTCEELGLTVHDWPEVYENVEVELLDSLEDQLLAIGIPVIAHDSVFALMVIKATPDIIAQVNGGMDFLHEKIGKNFSEMLTSDDLAGEIDMIEKVQEDVTDGLLSEYRKALLKTTTKGVFEALRTIGVEVAPDSLIKIVARMLQVRE